MLKHFLLFLLACTFTTFLHSQATYLKEYQQKWANNKAYTLELAEAMPEEFYTYRPSEEQRTFQEQLLHIVSNMTWLSSSYLGGVKVEADLKKKDYTKAEVIDIMTKAFELAGDAIEKLPAEELETIVKFFAGPMSKRQIMVLMNDHLVHHRGQVITYARLKGVKPPSYRGW